jgi:DNA-binding NarL/FixJ family response regulator
MQILLIDDHSLFRDALAFLISHRFPDVSVLHAGSLGEARRTIAAEPALRLALVDLSLPDSEGTGAVRALKAAAEHVTLVVISADERPETVLGAIDAGAASFIPKTARKAMLEEALETVLDGRVFVPQQTLSDMAPLQADDEPIDLSPRQRDVLRLLIEGKPNKTICRELDLSESTVKTHLAAIFRKLEVESRTQAVLAAARLGLRLTAA